MIKVLLLASLSITLFARGYHAPDNRSQAKKLVKMFHLDYKKTALNDCVYRYDITSCMDKTIVDVSTCSVAEVNQSMQWIQVVPDTFYARHMACMNEDVCVNEFSHKRYGNLLCCRFSSALFREMEADLYNLIPVVSAIADLRENQIFGDVEKPEQVVGKVRIDSHFIEPPQKSKGNIARVYLYMDKRYHLDLSSEQKAMFMRWHESDAVDADECALAKIINKVQGSTNRWIDEGCP